jgi:hypothetical protein
MTMFHCHHYECARRHDDEVNDKNANDVNDESSLSLDQWFVVCSIKPADRNVS